VAGHVCWIQLFVRHKERDWYIVYTTLSFCSCLKNAAKYTCPRCNCGYCSAECYKCSAHAQCSEGFYRDCFMGGLKDMQSRYMTAECLCSLSEWWMFFPIILLIHVDVLWTLHCPPYPLLLIHFMSFVVFTVDLCYLLNIYFAYLYFYDVQIVTTV